MMTAPNLALSHKASLGLFSVYVRHFEGSNFLCLTFLNLRC